MDGIILDLGTDPATQAIQLSGRGLMAIGSDTFHAPINSATKFYLDGEFLHKLLVSMNSDQYTKHDRHMN